MQPIGATPNGNRRVGLVAGGTFAGGRLRGTVLPGGADWIIARPDGCTTLDVRLVLQTEDGAAIGMIYRGLRHGPAEIMQRLDRGEPGRSGRILFPHRDHVRDRGGKVRLAQSHLRDRHREPPARRTGLPGLRSALSEQAPGEPDAGAACGDQGHRGGDRGTGAARDADPRRYGRRNHQGRNARGRPDAADRSGPQSRHGRVFSDAEPQQEKPRARPEAEGGTRGHAAARRNRRRFRSQHADRRGGAARHRLHGQSPPPTLASSMPRRPATGRGRAMQTGPRSTM